MRLSTTSLSGDAIIAEIEDLKVSWSERVRILLLKD
jgi:hypothetical protein